MRQRPLCPACKGTLRRWTTGGEIPCSLCDDGLMRDVTAPTADELDSATSGEKLSRCRRAIAAVVTAARPEDGDEADPRCRWCGEPKYSSVVGGHQPDCAVSILAREIL